MMLKNDVFFEMVMLALQARKTFSTVRMSDGERMILEWTCALDVGPDTVIDHQIFDNGWHSRFGTSGITSKIIRHRLCLAFDNCTYFCPGAGIQHLFAPHRNPFADKMNTYEWTRAQRKSLLEQAQEVVLINRDGSLKNLFERQANAHFTWLKLSKWQETEAILKAATVAYKSWPLFLLSGGPAGKYLAPAIAEANNCMVLDVGQGMDAWFMPTGAEVGMA